MAGTWLEARSCEKATRELDRETVLHFPPLGEAMKVAENAAENAGKKGGHWEYSVKLADAETQDIAELFAGSLPKDDGRSAQRTIDVRYNGRCYSLTLFVLKE